MDDLNIIELLKNRSEQALSEMQSKYGAYCRKVAVCITGSEEDARECENDAYEAVWNTVPPAEPANLKAYIAKTVRNISLTRFGYNTAQKRRGCTLAIDELSEIVSGKESVESSFESGEIAAAISSFLRGCGEESRTVFVRRYFYSESVAEISQRLGLSESKVKSSLFRTRKKLKAHLEKEGIEL